MKRQAFSGRWISGFMAFSLAAILTMFGSGCEQGGSTGDLLGDASALSGTAGTDGLAAGDGLGGLTIEAIDARVELTEGQIEPMTIALGQFQAAREERVKDRQGRRGGGPGRHGGMQGGPQMGQPQGEPPMLAFLAEASDILTQGQFVGLAELIKEQRDAWQAEREAAGFGGGRGGPGFGRGGEGRGGGFGGHQGDRPGMGQGPGQAFFEELDLTDAQRERIEAIHETTREQMQALREQVKSGDLTREQARDQREEIRDEARAQVEAILTAEQLEQLETLRRERQSERVDQQIERLGQNLDRRIDFMETVLDLTPSQVSQVEQILDDSVEARREILEQVKAGSLERDEARDQMKEIMDGVADSIEALLTPEIGRAHV